MSWTKGPHRDPRFATVDELQTLGKRVEHGFREQATEINRMHASRRPDPEVATKVIEKLEAKSTAYANLVIGAGYAGSLALWTSVKPDLPSWLFATIGLCLTLSLVIFVGWEVVKMVWLYHTLRTARYQAEVDEDVFSANSAKVAIDRFNARQYVVWRFFFYPTVFFASVAGVLLIGFFFYKLLQLF